MISNWFKRQAIGMLIGHRYENDLNVSDNFEKHYCKEFFSIFDLGILLVGLYFIWREFRWQKE